MIRISPLLLSLLPVASLAGCAPENENIPSSASTHWSLKDGYYWTWNLPAENGCVAWMAKEDWVSVQVLVDTPCENQREQRFLDGRGLSYFSVVDNLVFRGYWPWTSDIFTDLIIYDEEGDWVEALPCPYSLTNAQIEEMRVAVNEAISGANTDGERRVLSRITVRLAQIDGEALSSSQDGCTDEPQGSEGRTPLEKTDPWSAS